MRGRTDRHRSIGKALTALLPQAPYSDIEAIRALALQQKFRALPPSIVVWLSTVAHVRHEHSDYDRLLDEGYDREAARFFVMDDINRTLTRWRATRLLTEDDDESE